MIKTLTSLAANIPAALVGGTVFILSFIPLEFGIGLSCMVGLCGYAIAGTWIFPSVPASKHLRERGHVPAEMTQASSFTNLFKESEFQLSTNAGAHLTDEETQCAWQSKAYQQHCRKNIGCDQK